MKITFEEERKMKTFYKVVTKFYNSGKVTASIHEVLAEIKPASYFCDNNNCDEYHDYFNTQEEAVKFYKEALTV